MQLKRNVILSFCFQWNVTGASSPISHATFSCDGQMVYASFMDGTLAIFDDLLKLQRRIHPPAYLVASIR